MDASAPTKHSTRQKIFEGQSDTDYEDKISHLPEPIIHDILSFLPAKDAVRTCSLSTTWRHTWTSLHTLNFDDNLRSAIKKDILKKKGPFFSFVDRVLSVNDLPHIHKLCLVCQECDVAHLQKYISIAIERKVQEVVISVNNKQPYTLPYRLFTCETLRVLKIEKEFRVRIPASVCFSGLRVLHLESVVFFSDQSTREISLSCPTLEEFVLHYCGWSLIKTVNIFVPHLRRLIIKETSLNVLDGFEMKINAESLIYLKLETRLSHELFLCHLPSLVEAYLDLPRLYRTPDDNIICRLSSLLGGVYSLRKLEVTTESIQALSLPVFAAHVHSLSGLVHLRVVCWISMCGKQLIDLLMNMPKIESISFPNGIGSFSYKGNGRILGTTPNNYLSHLKIVDIKSFRGTRDQLWFVNFLMKSVRPVDKFTIRLTRCRDERFVKWKEWIAEKLKIPSKCSKCVLDLI